MTTVPLKEAKERLEELLAEGEFMVRLDDGSAFELVLKPQGVRRRGGLGRAAGQIWMADDFNSLPEGFEDYLP